MLVLITGVPGTGKSTVCEELRRRGYLAIDADEHDLCSWVNSETGETVAEPPAFSSRTPQFYVDHVWRYDPEQIRRLATNYGEGVCFMGGFASGADEILRLFTRAFFLHVGSEALVQRLMARTNGPFAGATDEHRAAQVARVLPRHHAFEAAWRQDGLAPVDASQPLEVVVNDLLGRCGLPFLRE